MGKQTRKDNSGFSMNALIRQVLMDGKVHSLEEIATHVQKYMCKTMPFETFQPMVAKLLEQDDSFTKTRKGYKLSSGESVQDMVARLISEADGPLTEKEIKRLVAKEQHLPLETVELDLEGDRRFAQVIYRKRKFYYLARRKKINSVVYKILKEKERPLSLSEIYRLLETEHKLKKKDVIFLPREDAKLKREAGPKYTLKSAAKKKKPPEPTHNITRQELEKVVNYLKESGEHLTVKALVKKVLNMPDKKTNLRIKLTRDPRLKRDKEKFYYEVVQEKVEIPKKIVDKVSSLYFKVIARLVGIQEPQSIEELLERIYKVNLTNMEYEFYHKLLLEHLMNDEGVVRTFSGWLKHDADARTKWSKPKSFSPVRLPEPRLVLAVESLNPLEQRFLDAETRLFTSDQSTAPELLHIVNSAEFQYGAIPIHKIHESIFPAMPLYFEVAIVPEQFPERRFTAFVHRPEGVLMELKPIFDLCEVQPGTVIRLWKDSDEPLMYHLAFSREEDIPQFTPEYWDELQKLIDQDWEIHALLQAIFRLRRQTALSIYELWRDVTAIRSVHRRDFLAALQDYVCFVPDKEKEGYYRFDESAGLTRFSIKAPEEKKPKEKPVRKKKPPKRPEEEKPQPKTEKASPVAPQKVSDVKKETPSRPVVEKKVKRRKEKEVELPEHLRRLKTLGRKLPKLRTVKSMVVKPAEDRHGSRIGAVSVGRIDRTSSRDRRRREKIEQEIVLLKPPALPEEPEQWEAGQFVNPEKGKGHADLYQALEVLKTFVKRSPKIRKTDGSIVIFLDNNDISIYFRIPPENPECWIAWIPDVDINAVSGAESFLQDGAKRAKHSQKGYWWATQKFRGPKGNWKDNNVLEGVQIMGKIIELMDKPRK